MIEYDITVVRCRREMTTDEDITYDERCYEEHAYMTPAYMHEVATALHDTVQDTMTWVAERNAVPTNITIMLTKRPHALARGVA